jgi:hypothetical protein
MASPAFSTPLDGAVATRASAHAPSWPLWSAFGSSLTVAFGVDWDIAWHRSIGRDTFWSPPHIAIYSAAVLAAAAALARILPATFADRQRDTGVHVLGFRGPLGAFIAAWGGVAMLSSAPFDDWWHNAYGLDVKILSPPHVALAVGILCLHLGALVLLAGAMNRATSVLHRRLESLVVATGAMMLVTILTVLMEKVVRVRMHGGLFYVVVALCAPFVLTAMSEASGGRWGATKTAALYSLFLVALLWTFPLVPAEPKLGPVLVQVRSLIPPEFPLLLLPAAAVLDRWLLARRAHPGAATVVGGGVLFAATFFVFQWPFATFLMSPYARNYFWGAKYFDFWTPAWAPYRRYAFIEETTLHVVLGIALSLPVAVLSVAGGRAWGRWLARVQR